MNAETGRNHAEYGPILAHMGPLFAEIRLQSGPILAPRAELGATTRRKTVPSAECIVGSPPGGDLYASWGGPMAGDALSKHGLAVSAGC